MPEFRLEEYRALRATIAHRGSIRLVLSVGGFAAWALALIAVLAWLPNPIAGSIPLTLLLATFEVNRMLHLAVERIGRYLQVFYEAETVGSVDTPAWETTAMAFGPAMPGAGGHPLLLPIFIVATVVNLLAVVLPGPVPLELGVMTVPHLAFIGWMLLANRAMKRQRAQDAARFRELRTDNRDLRTDELSSQS